MKFPEPKTFRGAISPTILFNWTFGCGIFEFPTGHPRPFLSLLWSSIHFVVYLSSCFSIVRIPILPELRHTPLIKYYYYINSCFGTIFTITSMVSARRIQTLRNFNHRITKINKNLQTTLGIPEHYGAAFRWNLAQLFVAFIKIVIIAIASGIFIVDAQYFSLIIFWISRFYQMIFISTLVCTYCGLIRYTGNRFQQLNAHILQLTFGDSETKPCLQSLNRSEFSPLSPIVYEIHGDLRLAKAADIRRKVYVLREVRSIHHELRIATEEINRVFGTQLVFVMGMSIYNIISLLFGLYVTLTSTTMFHSFRHDYLFYSLSWLSFFLIVVFYVVHCSSTVSDEAQKIGKLMYEVAQRSHETETQDEINAFSIQLLKNPLKLTANGLFVLDYKMICAMGGLVSTYLVILIQMYGVNN
ncbi:putative gustatory receptor 28a [Neodiprion lecontei]|uniref:Gustatory receptor n=1 Tax=Neodiprion lecontei TaxID=441921 RepID=A0ABM3FP56_NEOLC|nr:putative gustatory receptor 28a [Neodiprion lecontei]